MTNGRRTLPCPSIPPPPPPAIPPSPSPKVSLLEAALRPAGSRRSVVANRVSNVTGRVGPRVVLNEATGVSLMVTRTIGDSLGPSALTSVPELVHATVPDGSR